MTRKPDRGRWRNPTGKHGRTRSVPGGIGDAEWTAKRERAGIEIGRSVYRLETADSLVVSDSLPQDDGSWRAFAMLRRCRNKA